LKFEFQLTELGTLVWLLEIQIEFHSDTVTLFQPVYINKLLSKFGITSYNPVTLPFDLNSKVKKFQDSDNIVDVTLYH